MILKPIHCTDKDVLLKIISIFNRAEKQVLRIIGFIVRRISITTGNNRGTIFMHVSTAYSSEASAMVVQDLTVDGEQTMSTASTT